LIEGVWNLDNRDNSDTLPFAGTKNKVLIVNPKEKFLHDNYRSMFGESKAPFGISDDKSNSQIT
jgi:hypothetical protein